MIDKKLALMLYQNGNGYSKIASQLHVSRQRIHQIVANYKNFGHDRLSKKKLKKLGKNCSICRQPFKDIHHIDRNNLNDDISNLMPLCERCHYEIHRGEKRKYIGLKKIVKIPKRLYKWSMKYKECRYCLSSTVKHGGKGLCKNCYEKERRIKLQDF